MYLTKNQKEDIRLCLRYVAPVLVAALLIFTAYCSVRTEPGKVWNLRGKIVTLAENLVGLPYQYGGEDLDGFDCSGLVYYVFDSFGVNIPRTAKKQGRLKGKVKLRRAKPGDIVVFKLSRRRWHTGIYTGSDTFIHAPNRNAPVRKEHLNKYWKNKLKKVVRVLD